MKFLVGYGLFCALIGALLGATTTKLIARHGKKRFWIHNTYESHIAAIFIQTKRPKKNIKEWIEVIGC